MLNAIVIEKQKLRKTLEPNWKSPMKKSCAIVLATGLLSGCALPIPITIASLLADGYVLATANKTVLGHGLSSVMGKDCGLMNALSDKDFCHDWDAGTAVAAPSDAGEWTAAQAPLTHSELENYTLASANWGHSSQADVLVASNGAVDAGEMTQKEAPLLLASDPDPYPEMAEAATPQKQYLAEKTIAQKPAGRDSLYFVIGSFYAMDRAELHAKRYPSIDSQVFELDLGDRMVYRVAVGPFTREQQKAVRAEIHLAGIKNPWAVYPDGVGSTAVARPNAPSQVAENQTSQ